MFTLHHTNAVSSQKHLGSDGTSMGQRVVSQTLKTIQWLVLWVKRNKDDVDKSTLFLKQMYKLETIHFHRRVRRSDVHRGISARRINVETHLCDRKMPCSTYQTQDHSEVRTASHSLRSSSQEADFKGTWSEHWPKSIIGQSHLQSYSGYSQLTRNNNCSLPTGQQKYWKTLPWINGDMSQASKTQQILAQQGCPSKGLNSLGG